ncbi:vancomycin resistance protein YoaR [Kineococcus xinjiangensis]|uniref:Vancomycin resistance protein YoaR n=1 Tax=Kineococcus xinjiangensis TaxID=512762 RepID=A0A2S6IFV5_9ACTN|nr:VanW family protein [Kineococcus xinjiangensis]PPK93091.1 vancomycin resistance protein YoaR [Kineococcus xinjiangensis]
MDQQHLATSGAPSGAAQGPVPRGRRLPGRPWLWWTGGALALTGAAYGGAALATAGEVPRGTTVAGVDVGGLSRAEAEQSLSTAAGSLGATPVPVVVSVAGEPVEAALDPAAAGLRLDVEATLEELTGSSWDPRVLWRHVAGGWEAEPVTDVDAAALREALRGFAERVDAAPVEGSITFVEGRAVAGEAREGRRLDVVAGTDLLAQRWPLPAGTTPVELPADVLRPRVDAEEVATAMREAAEPAVSGPLVVVTGGREVVLPPEAFTPALSMQAGPRAEGPAASEAPASEVPASEAPATPAAAPAAATTPAGKSEGQLLLTVDGIALEAAVLAAAPDLEVPPRDATVEIRDGVPVVVPAVDGADLDPVRLAEAALPALTSPERRAVVELVPRPAELTTAEAEALGVREVISTFSTKLTSNAARTENIRRAAESVDGTLLEPGEEFSLNQVVGERTAARGFNKAPVINNGLLVDGYGGGVSQLATTTFNAMFFAGLDELEHKPHSFYISRYPEGREATVDWRSIDLRFRNDSAHGVLVKAEVAGGQVTVTFWGTKEWDVQAEKSPRRNIRTPGVKYDESPKCEPQDPHTGFDVDVTRIARHLVTGEVRRETWSHRYKAGDRVICGPDPAKPKPTPTPEPAAPVPAPAPGG